MDGTDVSAKAGFLHATETDLLSLNEVATNQLYTNGIPDGRSIIGIDKLVNADKALVLIPQQGSILEQKVTSYINMLSSNSATSTELGQALEDIGEQIVNEMIPSGQTIKYSLNSPGFDISTIK